LTIRNAVRGTGQCRFAANADPSSSHTPKKQPVWTSQTPLLTPISATRLGFSDFINPADWIDFANRSLKQRTEFPSV